MSLIRRLFGSGDSPNPPDIPDLLSASEEGFVDLTFAIVESESTADGLRLRGTALYRDDTLEIVVTLGPDWIQGTMGDDIPCFQGKATYSTAGRASDLLLAHLDRLYGTNASPRNMTLSAPFVAISLQGDPRHPEMGPVHLKLFFESDDEDRYAEIYTNIDFQQKRLYIREKDPEYRLPVITALTRSAA